MAKRKQVVESPKAPAARLTVTLSKGGLGERKVNLVTTRVPDLWHAAMRVEDKADRDLILDVWHFAHDLRRHILKEHGFDETV